MSGRWSRNKGARTERAIARLLQRQGIAAVKVSRAYQPGHDIAVPLAGEIRLAFLVARNVVC